jgi:TetR/AcrR family transcriptional regulator, transcriptional repressor for nem operon
MGRPRGFQDQAVADQILQCFWRLGYHGTSIDDLTAATGLNRASLYNAFGDKEAMFATALSRYAETIAMPWITAAGRLDDHRRLLRGLAATAGADPDHRGCLMVNTAVERGPHHRRSRDAVREHFEALADALGADDEAWAKLAAMLGLLVLSKAGVDRSRLAAAASVIGG